MNFERNDIKRFLLEVRDEIKKKKRMPIRTPEPVHFWNRWFSTFWGKMQFIPENLFPAICLVSSNTWPHWHDRQDSVFWGKEINIAFTHAIVNNVTHFRDCHPDVHANWNQDAWTEMNCTPDKISSYNFLSRLQLVITSFLPENYNENNNNNGNNNKYNNNYNYKFTETTRLLNQEIIIILVLKFQDWTKC